MGAPHFWNFDELKVFDLIILLRAFGRDLYCNAKIKRNAMRALSTSSLQDNDLCLSDFPVHDSAPSTLLLAEQMHVDNGIRASLMVRAACNEEQGRAGLEPKACAHIVYVADWSPLCAVRRQPIKTWWQMSRGWSLRGTRQKSKPKGALCASRALLHPSP